MLTLQNEIAQAMVYGDRRPPFVALLVHDPEVAEAPDVRRRPAAAVDGDEGAAGAVAKRNRILVDNPHVVRLVMRQAGDRPLRNLAGKQLCELGLFVRGTRGRLRGSGAGSEQAARQEQ